MKKNQPVATKQLAVKNYVTQTLLIALFIFLLCQNNLFAQINLNKTFTLSVEKTEITKILSEVQKQTDTKFVYSSKAIKADRKISYTAKAKTLEFFLKEDLKTLKIGYSIMDNRILLFNSETVVPATDIPAEKKPDIFIVPPKTVSGKITSLAGQLMDRASINIKGTERGTVTNVKGEFAIKVNTNDVLIISSMGFNTEESVIGDNTTTINVKMFPLEQDLNDVVVIGYATQSRKDLTGAVSSVNAAQLKDIPVNSALQVLEGRLAGVNITTTEGGPNAAVTIKVRGGGSITQDNTPLYVVDGVQMENALDNLSPQDIASVDVLKDAASTSIYGARGANGVVIITTKGGKAMRTVVAYNYFYGVNKLVKEFDVMNPKEFIEYNWEKTRNSLIDSVAFASQYGKTWASLDSFRNKPNVDWQKLTFGSDAVSQTHNMSVTGGNKTTTFNIGYTNNNEESIMVNSYFTRNIFNMRFDHNVSDKFKVGVNFAYNDQTVFGTGTSTSGSTNNNRLRNSVKYRPFLANSTDPNNANDQAYFDYTSSTGYYLIDPIQFANASYRSNQSYNINMSGYLNYTFNKFFQLRVTGGMNQRIGKLNVFDDYITWNAISTSSGQPIVNIVNSSQVSTTENAVLNFSNSAFKSKFSSNNVITALVGQETYALATSSQSDQVRYFPIGITAEKAFSQLSLGTPVPLSPSAADAKSTISSFFTRIGYSHKNKYLATFNMRGDGSSKFAAGHQWGYFPSGSVAWRISNENFYKKNNFASDIKLRLSYGLAGNNRINDFLYTSLYNSTSSPYSLNNTLIPGYAISSLANPNLKWETTLSRNAGLDVSLFKNHLQLTFDAYINDTRDLLINVPIAANAGFTNQLQNVGSVQNRGFELQLSTVAISNKSLKWNINFNISTNHNEITKLSNVADHYSASSGWGAGNEFLVQVGQPVGTIWGYKADGMYTLDDFNYNSANSTYVLKAGVADNTAAVGPPAPGTKKLKDLTNDGIVNIDDQTILGNAQPKFTGGLNNQLIYKNFDLSIFVNFVVGNKILNGDKVEFSNAYAGAASNLTANMNGRWKTIDANGVATQWNTTVAGKQIPAGAPPSVLAAINKDANIWQPIKGGNYLELDSWAIEDGSFLRVNNITLGYSIPMKSILKASTSSLRFYCTVNNLAVLTKYTGLDPEVSTKNYNYVTPGVDSSPYPRSRSFIVGVNVKF